MSAKSHLSHDFQLPVMQYIHLRFDLRGSDEIKISAYNSDTFLLFCNLSLMINVPTYVTRVIHYFNNGLDRYNDTYFTVLFSISLSISIVCKYTIWYLRRDCNQGHRLRVHLPTLQVIYMFSVLTFYALRLFTQIYDGNCTSVHSLNFLEMLMCNPNHLSNGMPFRFTFGLLLTPILTKTALRDISFRAYTVAWMAVVIVLAIVSMNLPFAQTYPVYSMVVLLLYMSIEQDRADVENHLLREHFRTIESAFLSNDEEGHADLEAAVTRDPSQVKTGEQSRCISTPPIFDIRSGRVEDIENKWRLLDNFKSYDIKYSNISDIACVYNETVSSVVPELKRQDTQLPSNDQRSAIDQSHCNYWIELLNDVPVT